VKEKKYTEDTEETQNHGDISFHMLRIDDTIFSFDILTKKFRCNLAACHGNCCRYGDSGAPLNAEEVKVLDEIWPEIKPYLRHEGIEVLEAQGRSVKDFENDWVTPLIEDRECAYAVVKGNIFMCGIEVAWADSKIAFKKPLSCHLYPVRIKNYPSFRAVNYQEISICASGLKTGKNEGIYLYQFLKDPLIRALGDKLYRELCIAAEELRKNEQYLF
jgi:hypothetical protein